MKLVKSLLLGSAAGLTVVAGAQAADLPEKAAVPIEYVRVCTAYGAGFFYIPGTDTCLRISGRARFEAGYINSDNRRIPGGGDLSGFIGLLRFNVDARTQTDYGTLRTFLRLDAASRTGHTKSASGSNLRGGYAFNAVGQDTFNRIQNFINVDKAFVQFAGLTAGRASSFFDFYANDYEIMGVALGSNMPSTNLAAYTQKWGDGWSTTLSMEDPNYRKNPLYSLAFSSSNPSGPGFAQTQSFPVTAPTPIILTTDAAGNATGLAFIDAVQRSRMPDFVGSLRYDAAWGSMQLSGAVKDVNTGGFISGSAVGLGGATIEPNTAAALLAARGISAGAQTDYGWAVQGGVKFNLPFIAPGDGLYLQGAYGEGANMYTGVTRATASYLSNASVYTGNPFNQFLADAVVNPLTGKLELATSWTVTASYLHYWTPQWRSAFFGSYGEVSYGKGSRFAVGLANDLIGASSSNAPPSPIGNASGFALSPALRDTNQIAAGTSLIWSPVKDLDIGVEGAYVRTALKNGRALNSDQGFTVNVGGVDVPVNTRGSHEYYRAAFRVQRDF